jgi:hypothetical protein
LKWLFFLKQNNGILKELLTKERALNSRLMSSFAFSHVLSMNEKAGHSFDRLFILQAGGLLVGGGPKSCST